ncbi:MAG: hypothetical protein ACRER3_26375 [Pseudomonas fluorescens]
MIIKLSPQRRDDSLKVTKSGDILTINGDVFDLSFMNDGDTLPQHAINSQWFAGDVNKTGGELAVTLILPHPYNASEAQRFPVDLVNVPDGPVALPQSYPVEEAPAE